MKILTVSIAAYNIEKTLKRAVYSLIKNNRKKDQLEILIINDGSTDNTSQIAHSLQYSFPTIVRVIDKKNGGYGSTINSAIPMATGKYFKLLDGDDWYDSDNIEKFIDFLDLCNTDMVLSAYSIIHKDIQSEFKAFPVEETYYHRSEYIDFYIPMHGVCFLTSILKSVKMKMLEKCLYTDAEFVFFPMYYINSFAYFNDSIYQYSFGDEGQSVSVDNKVQHIADLEKVINEIAEFDIKNRHKCNNNRKMIEKLLVFHFQSYIDALILCPISHKNLKTIIAFDKNIKNSDYELYKNMENLTLRLLRKSNYMLYPFLYYWLNYSYRKAYH